MRRSSSGFPGRSVLAASIAAAIAAAVAAQQGGTMKEVIQSKLAAIKQSQAANQAALRQYGWTETVQFALKGEVKSNKQMSCRYGPDGKVARTPIGPPPEQQKMEQAFQAGNVSLDRPGAGEAGLVFKNYAKPGDSMTLDFNMGTKKLAALNVSSYMSDPSQPVAVAVQFATLPDGTSYPNTTVLTVPAQAIQVTITNSNYQKLTAP